MKSRDGFVSMIVLIIICVLFTMALYLGHITRLEYSIMSATKINIQNYYQAESKIYMSIYDEKYYLNQLYPEILDVFRKNNFATLSKRVIIDKSDLESGDTRSNIKLEFKDENNRIQLKLRAQSNFKDTISEVSSSGHIVNEIFEKNYPVLTPSLVEDKDRKSLIETLETIQKDISIFNCYRPTKMFGAEFTDYDRITLSRKGSNDYEISSTRETMTNPFVERFDKRELFLVAKSYMDKPVDLFIGDPEQTNQSNDAIELYGVIYVEGNIIISSKFNFMGILIVKDGKIIVDSIERPKIHGLIMGENIGNSEDFIEEADIINSRHVIYQFGTYLPGFLDIKIDRIKGN